MDPFKTTIFGKKTLSGVLKEIYDTQKKRDQQIIDLILDLKPLVKELGDATLLVPLIKDYLDMGLKNDDNLIKMATLVQRIINSSGTPESGGGIGIPDKEKAELLAEIRKIKDDE